MFLFKCLYAAVLLTTPPDQLELSENHNLHETMAPTLRAIALEWELMDKREVGYVLSNPQDFNSDLKLLQGRYQSLIGAPLIFECKRFPDRDAVSDLMAFNRAYRDSLSTRLALDRVHAEDLQAALRETDELYRILDTVRDARCEYYYVTYRRQALQQLREMVGAQAFYSGQLPPNVPLWRIPVVD